ncbi:MAG: hypothetical protein EXR28_05635 [Betaproteobacteria bacterium]|nr:hypothetical protein [Betaproteobacteria bacterium]
MAKWRVGVDTGGTFTDLAAVDHESGETFIANVPSTPAAPADAIGIRGVEVQHAQVDGGVGHSHLLRVAGIGEAVAAHADLAAFEEGLADDALLRGFVRLYDLLGAPNVPRHVEDALELAPLLILGQLDRTHPAKTALRAERQLFERQITRGIVDAPFQIVHRLEVGALGGD